MADEQHPDGDDAVNRSDADSRRQFLQLVAAGVVGGAAVAGFDRLGDEMAPDERLPEGRASGPTTYDAFVYQRDTGYEAVDSAGGTISAGSDGWSVLRDSIDTVPDGGSIYVSGRYEGASTLEVDKSIRMDGHEAHVEYRAAGDFAFRFEGTERYQSALAEPVGPGANTIELNDASEIQKGDMVLLEEEDGEPVLGREQPPGEPHSVLETDGSTVRLEDSIVWRDEYPAGTLVYVVDPIEVHVSGFRLQAPSKNEDFYGVAARQCRDSTFENLWLDKFGSRGILLAACANFRVRDCTVLQSSDIQAADGYGIQVWAGCHDVVVEGCVAKECRHPLSVTPGGEREVASRSITFRDCFVTSNGSAALNCHGGAAHDVRFEGCMVHSWGNAGVRTGAQETNVSGCEFRMSGHNAITTRNDGQEMILTVTDTDVFGATNAVELNQESEFEFEPLWKLVHLDGMRAHGCNGFFDMGSGAIDRVRELVIANCYWDEVSEEGVDIRNRIDGGVIEGNDFGAAPNTAHVRVRDDSTAQVTDLHIVGNRFSQPSGDDTFVRLAQCQRCVVSDNKFESGTDVNIYEGGTNSAGNLIKQNTYFAPNASADPVRENENSRAVDNYVYDTSAGRWL